MTVAPRSALVVTTIYPPTAALRQLAQGARDHDWDFIVIGDLPTPPDFALDHGRYLAVGDQRALTLRFPAACPVRHYARKCIGYLLAMQNGAELIVETDDDNFPEAAFFAPVAPLPVTPVLRDAGWANVYRYFTDDLCWPRGFPLDRIKAMPPPLDALPSLPIACPIQQGLADLNPDVDAIYRLVMPLPVRFARERSVALAGATWCPFNSQNTLWWPPAYALMYLPATCSFRMTDIWRGFVAQRIAGANGWGVLFRSPTVWQERNAHDLLKDFRDEIPGYLNSERLMRRLSELDLRAGEAQIPDNMRACYEALSEIGMVEEAELPLLECWLDDVKTVTAP